MSMLNLNELGYKLFDSEEKSVLKLNIKTDKYQRRVDLDDGFNLPLCKTNDKVFINITEVVVNGACSHSIFLKHEIKGGVWVNIELSCELINNNDVGGCEEKILQMWDLANK